MKTRKYRVTFIDGTVVEDLTHEEATEFFYSHASSRIEPWPVEKYKAP